MVKILLEQGGYYHIFNRGVDKRKIFLDRRDLERFYLSMVEFNTLDPIGSIFERSFQKNRPLGSSTSKRNMLVTFVAYCLNPNHFHFLLRQKAGRGIEKFMQRLGTGYTNYFNERRDRSGVLFQGRFKAVHVETNEQLLHVSGYVNLNYKVHRLGSSTSKSSWLEYMEGAYGICETGIILDQFGSPREYGRFVEDSLPLMWERKELDALALE